MFFVYGLDPDQVFCLLLVKMIYCPFSSLLFYSSISTRYSCVEHFIICNLKTDL